jgi:hypothetical protein
MATDVASADRERGPDRDSHPNSVEEEPPAASAAGGTGTSLGERQVQAAAAPTAEVGAAEDPAERAADDRADKVMRAMESPDPVAGGAGTPAGAPATPSSASAGPAAPGGAGPVAAGATPAAGAETIPSASPEEPIRRQPEVATPGGSAPVVAGPEAPGGGAEGPGPAETGTPAPEPEPPAPEGEPPARGTPVVSADVQEYLDASRGQGAPIPEGPRKQFEDQFQRSFADVGIHHDSAADDAAKSIDALAFTRGNDIYFRSGAYDPTSPAGKRLLAHELAHVAQQRSGVNRQIRRREAGGSGGAVVRRAKNKGGSSPKDKKPKGTEKTFENTNEPKGKIDVPAKRLLLNVLTVPGWKGVPPFAVPPYEWRKGSEKRPTDQRALWWKDPELKKKTKDGLEDHLKNKLKLGSPPYYLVDKSKSGKSAFGYVGTTEEIASAIVIPPWHRRHSFALFDVDHLAEWQIGGKHEIANMWLLDPKTNQKVGNDLKIAIYRQIDDFLKEANPKLEKPQTSKSIKGGDWAVKWATIKGEGRLPPETQWWKREEIGTPKHLEGLVAADDKKIKDLKGSPDRLAIYPREGGGHVRHVPLSGKSGKFDVKSRGWQLQRVTWTFDGPVTDNTPAGTDVGVIEGTAFKKDKGGAILREVELKPPIKSMPGVDYGGVVDRTAVTALRKSIIAKVASPIDFTELEFDLDKGLVGRGTIPKPSLKILENVAIDVVLDGEPGLEATITGDALKLPGPFTVQGGALVLGASTSGLTIDGQIDFEITNLATGYLRAAAGLKQGGPSFALEGGLDFDTELFDKASLKLSYRDGKWGVEGELAVGPGKVKGIDKASAKVAFADEVLTADGTFEPAIKGIKSGKVGLRYAEATGMEITGLIELGEGVPGIKSGKLDATIKQSPAGGWSLAGGVSIEPAIPGVTAAIAGRYEDGAFNVVGTLGYERGVAKGSITLGVTNAPVDDDGKITGPPVPNGGLIPYGAGLVTLRMTPWLKGTVGLKLKPNGEIEVSGEVALPSTFDLFPEKKIEKELLSIGVDIPIIGVAAFGQRIGIFATVRGEVSIDAGFGPGQLRNAVLKVDYNPDHPDDTKVTGAARFHVPASAGLQLSVDGGLGVGIPVVSATAGLSVYGKIGVAGAASVDAAVTWTPTAGVVLDARGELFVEPKFRFGVNAFVDVRLGLLVGSIELYRKDWELASFEYGSNLRFGLVFPLHYESGKPFELTYEQVQWTYPQIDPLDLIGGLVKQLVG